MTARLARVLPTPLALLLVTSLGMPASAQRLAFRVDGPASTAYGIVDPATGASTPVTADEAQVGAVFTSDGQYAVRAVSGLLSVRHIPSGQQVTVASDFLPTLAHPRRLTFFGIYGRAPARFDERGLVRWEACGTSAPSTPALDLTVDGQTLYASCPNGDLVGINTETGAEIRRLTAVGYSGLALNAAATEVVVLRGTGNSLFDLVRLDLATGQTVSTRRVLSIFGATVAPTPDHRRVLLSATMPVGPNVVSSTTLVDAVTLADVRGLAASLGYLSGHSAAVSPDGHDAFVVSSGFNGGATAAWIDIDTGASRASASVPAGYSLTLGYAPAPLPPVLSIAQVATGTVTLSWALTDVSPMVTGYRAEVGTAQGMTNLGVLSLGAGESFTASGVPPGRYFVRVRAANVNGTSGPSNEVVIDVP
jgi:hypothetical protein